MYLHEECPAPGGRNNDGIVEGIYLNGSISASFNPVGRTFEWDGDGNGGYSVNSIVCLDCDATLWEDEDFGTNLTLVQNGLLQERYPSVVWKE